MKNKGFTIIELMVVVVILAIIFIMGFGMCSTLIETQSTPQIEIREQQIPDQQQPPPIETKGENKKL